MSLPTKPAKKASRWRQLFQPELNPQFAGSAIRQARISTQSATEEPEAAPAIGSEPEHGDGPEAAPAVGEEHGHGEGPEAAAEEPYRSLWSRAANELGEESKYLRRVQGYLKDKYNIDSPADAIGQMLRKQHEDILPNHGVSQSRSRRFVRHLTKYISGSQSLVMGLARMDPHGTAPLVFGGFFCLIQVIQGGLQQSPDAVTLTMELGETIALWTCLEERQIKNNLNPSLKDLYAKLGDEIVEMYKAIIILLGKLLPYFDGKWRKFLNVLAPEKEEWVNCNKLMKGHEATCNRIKEQISIEKTEQERISTALKWISSHDFRGAYKAVQERTKIDTVYKDRAQWVVNDDQFQSWDTPGESSILWLRGTIGTGKTMLMARAMHEVAASGEIDANSPAMFFFDKIANVTSVDTCVRSITRQLSWNRATSGIELAADRVYTRLKDERPADSLTTRECLELLEGLLSGSEAYIMIDAIDECKNPNLLLETLVTLNESVKGNGSLHIMLTGRMRPPVLDYFENCLTIRTSSAASLLDQEFYIETEIERKKQLRKGSLFFASKKNFPERLKGILKTKAQGLFRWIEIKIAVFTGRNFNREAEIEKKLKQLDEHTLDPESDDVLREEYEKLLEDLGKDEQSQELALKMLQFIACSFWPLSATSLAEAINASMHGTDFYDLSADDVNRLLVGFVSEVNLPGGYYDYSNGRYNASYLRGYVAVKLAHASVLEYLMDESANTAIAARFTKLAQHSEAATLCLAYISHGSLPGGDAIIESSSCHLTGHEIERTSVSDLVFYSCVQWPKHCRVALAEGVNTALTTTVSEFIASKTYSKWNHVLRGLMAINKYLDFNEKFWMADSIWHYCDEKKPGFVLAACDMTTVLEDPLLKPMIKMGDINGKHQTLFEFSLCWSKRETILKLLELDPEPIEWKNAMNFLGEAIDKCIPEAVERLLDSCRTSRGNNHQYGQSITIGLYRALLSLAYKTSTKHVPKDSVCEDSVSLSEIIRLLLANRANLFATDSLNRGMMHFASQRFAQELLVDHARKLEEKDLEGSVQRLLRIRNCFGQTPLNTAPSATLPYLKDQLSQAVQRDGKVMYDFENIDMPAVTSGAIRKSELLEYLRTFVEEGSPLNDNSALEDAGRQYGKWMVSRIIELKQQYSSRRREILRNDDTGTLEEELPYEWDVWDNPRGLDECDESNELDAASEESDGSDERKSA